MDKERIKRTLEAFQEEIAKYDAFNALGGGRLGLFAKMEDWLDILELVSTGLLVERLEHWLREHPWREFQLHFSQATVGDELRAKVWSVRELGDKNLPSLIKRALDQFEKENPEQKPSTLKSASCTCRIVRYPMGVQVLVRDDWCSVHSVSDGGPR